MTISDKALIVLDYVRGHPTIGDITTRDVAKELDMTVPSVTGVVNSLVRKGLLDRTEEYTYSLEDGTEFRERYLRITQLGLDFKEDE